MGWLRKFIGEVKDEWNRQESMEQLATQFAPRLVEYNKHKGLRLKCWKDVKTAQGWIKCQERFTKPMFDIYSKYDKFLEENSELLQELNYSLATIENASIYKILNTDSEQLEHVKQLLDNITEEQLGILCTIQTEVINLIQDTVEKESQTINIDHGNAMFDEHTQRTIFQTARTARILGDEKHDAYGQALKCFNLNNLNIVGGKGLQNKLKFVEENKFQMQRILLTAKCKLEPLTRKAQPFLNKKIGTPFGQVPQAWIDLNRKIIEWDMEAMLEKYTKLIAGEKYSKELLDKTEDLQGELIEVLEKFVLECEVLKRSGVLIG